MPSLKRVIAYIRTMMDGVMSTHNAGHAPQEHTTQVGKVTTALVTKPLSPPVKRKSKPKTSVAPSTKAAKSRKPAQKPAQTTSGKRGSQQATPALPTQSPAPTKRKQKIEVAPPTTAARKPGKKKPTARQVAMVSQSKPTGSKSKIPASKTRQHAK